MLLAALTALAFATDTEFAGTAAPVPEPPPEAVSKLTAELGATIASGNAVFYAINGAANGSHEWDRNKLGVVGTVNLGAAKPDTDGDTLLSPAERALPYQDNVKRYFISGRYDRFFSDRDSLYALAGAFHDPFAGYRLRSNQQIGYSRRLIKNEDTELRTEIGFDYAQEQYVDGVDPGYQDIFAARVLVGIQHKFNDQVGFEDVFEIYENVIDLEDVRILNTASISAGLSKKLSLKLSHILIFDNVPVEGFVKLDQTTMVTFVASIL